MTVFLLFYVSNEIQAKTIKTYNTKKMKRIIHQLNSKGIEYSIKHQKKKVLLFSVIVRDAKVNRNKKLKRNKKIIFKNKLFYKQYTTTKKDSALKKLKQLVSSKLLRKNLKIIKIKSKRKLYTISFNNNSSVKDGKESEVLTEYRLAQSLLKIEYQIGNSNEYSGRNLDLYTGVEIENEKYTGKVMGRGEYFQEKVSSNEGDEYSKINFELGETYLNFEVKSGQLTIGKQMFSWGVFDEFSNLDRTNIKNLPRFVFDSGESYRRPVSAIRYELYHADWKLDTFFDFGVEPGKELDEESLWTGINRVTGQVRGANTDLLNPLLIKNIKSHFKKRHKSGQGLRLTHTGDGDISFTYLKAYSDLPTIELSDNLRNQLLLGTVNSQGLESGVNLKFFQETVFGIDYARTIGGQLFKFEATYIPESPVIDESLQIVMMKKNRVALGGDFEFDTLSTTLTWQVVSEQIISDEETLLDKTLKQYVLQSSSRLLEDKLEFGLKTIYNGNDKSSFLSPYMNYEYSDSDTIGISYYSFSGEEGSFFGYHKNDDFLSINYKKLF